MNALPKTTLVLEPYEQEPGLYVFELKLPRGTAHTATEAWGAKTLLPTLVKAGACNRWGQLTFDVPNEPNVLRCWVSAPTFGQLEALLAVLKEDKQPTSTSEGAAADPCYDIRISEFQRKLLHRAVHVLNTSPADLASREMKELDSLFDMLANSPELPLSTDSLNSFVL